LYSSSKVIPKTFRFIKGPSQTRYFPGPGLFRVRAKITSQNWRSDLVQVWLIRESKTTGIAGYFADFASEVSAKDGLKLRCKNVKLFLREPLVETFAKRFISAVGQFLLNQKLMLRFGSVIIC
jgi:hypothetical protein